MQLNCVQWAAGDVVRTLESLDHVYVSRLPH